MIEWYLKVLQNNYANFNGRARRSEYWYFALANIIIFIVLAILAAFAGFIMYIYWIYWAVIIVPSIAVGVRRLHDIGKSGWFYLFAFVPLLNIYLLVLFCTEGTHGTNQYGPDPKNPYLDINEIGTPDTM